MAQPPNASTTAIAGNVRTPHPTVPTVPAFPRPAKVRQHCVGSGLTLGRDHGRNGAVDARLQRRQGRRVQA
jgi:hypothetical protein